MDRELINEICVDTDSQQKMRLTYYLLTDTIAEAHCDLKVYGAEIDKEYIGGKNLHREKKIIKDLFFVRSEAEEFIQKIARNSVTPMGLKYAVQEHINEKLNLNVCEG